MLKDQKKEFVNEAKKELKKYKVLAVMHLENVPDKLVQKARNQLKGEAKFLIARKTLLAKIIESNDEAKKLLPYISGNTALILSNSDPMDIYKKISSNRLKLYAKPNQMSPSDITIDAGETTIPPGQAVTELKAAGIDVQIQKGKVVIAKTKVLVPKGSKISLNVAKALKTLDVMPFETGTSLSVILADGLLYLEDVLNITTESVVKDAASAFSAAYELSLKLNYITKYNVDIFLKKAYLEALTLGLHAKIYEPTISEKLLAEAVLQALALKEAVKEDAPAEEGEKQQTS
jgi:large subunit ribosomal protein L10